VIQINRIFLMGLEQTFCGLVNFEVFAGLLQNGDSSLVGRAICSDNLRGPH